MKINAEDLLGKLVSIPSCSSDEQMIQEYIGTYLGENGYNFDLIGRNILVKITGIDQGNAIVFNAHVDTVTYGEPKNWKYPPYGAQIVDGKLYGLGASDEKAGVASLLLLAERYVKYAPACDVYLQFVVNEEIDGSGTRDVMNSCSQNGLFDKYKHIAGVLVEPTGLTKIEIGHKGNVFVALDVKGDTGHGSNPGKIKRNSVLIMAKVLQKIARLHDAWQIEFSNPVLGHPSIGVGTSIMAGDAKVPNKFADTCTATLDVRTIPEMHDKVLEILRKYLATETIEVEAMYDPAQYGLTEYDSPLIAIIKKILPDVVIGVSHGSTDQCFFTKYNIPAIVLGPGEPSCIHMANEYCEVAKIDAAVELYDEIIGAWSDKMKGVYDRTN